MFCKHCGAPLDSDTKFCTSCGAGTEPGPAVRTVDPVGPSPVKVMIFGIVGLALSSCGLPGIILSAIALRLARRFAKCNGGVFGMAKVGRLLGTFGLIISIVTTVLWTGFLVMVFLNPNILKYLLVESWPFWASFAL